MTVAIKPRRLNQLQVAKILREYDLRGKVRAHLDSLGDIVWRRPKDLHYGHGPHFNTPARGHDAVVLTVFGPLGVTAYDDWIACVFDDDEMGFIVGASRPSGKWNHHAFVSYAHAPTSREQMERQLDVMLRGFKARLSWILPGGSYDTNLRAYNDDLREGRRT